MTGKDKNQLIQLLRKNQIENHHCNACLEKAEFHFAFEIEKKDEIGSVFYSTRYADTQGYFCLKHMLTKLASLRKWAKEETYY